MGRFGTPPLSGFESQIKKNISEFNFCITSFGGGGGGGGNNTVKGYISFG